MSQRRPNPTKWVWCVLVLSSGPAWSPVSSVTVRNPDKIPSTIEAHSKFFQDFFSVQLSPYKIEFGHVCEDPNTWEQRYEKKDFKNHRDMGKIRWGDKKGGYGEHYWDLNHAGHAGNKEKEEDEYDDVEYDDGEYDDGDYNEELQDYPETVEKANNEREDYYPDASEYEKSTRPKRENSKVEMQAQKGERHYEEKQSKQKRSNTEKTQTKRLNIGSKDHFGVNLMNRSRKDNKYRHAHEFDEKTQDPSEKHDLILVVDHKVKNNYEDIVKAQRHVPYKVSAGERVRNRQIATVSAPRLFLESSTGHIIDRVTGQAYVLRPVHLNSR